MLNASQKMESSDVVPMQVVKKAVDPLDQRYFGRPIRIHIAEFACVFSIIFLIVGGVLTWRWWAITPAVTAIVASGVLVSTGYRAPQILKPLWQGWMKFAMFLGMVVTAVLLSLVWILLAIPMALLMRTLGKKVLDLTFRSTAASYWEERDPKTGDFKLLERQY